MCPVGEGCVAVEHVCHIICYQRCQSGVCKGSAASVEPSGYFQFILIEHLNMGGDSSLMDQVKSAVESTGRGKDVLLLEGGASLREGHAVSLPTPDVARELSSHVIVIVKYRSDIRVLCQLRYTGTHRLRHHSFTGQ